MSSRSRWLILAFAVAGFGLAAASSYVHYRILTDPTYVSPCDISEKLNCTQVYMSRFGSVRGVPVALGGLIWFGLVGLVAAFATPGDKNSPAGGYLFALSTIGLAVILYLAYASFFVLRTGCLLCMGTYVCVIAIFVLSGIQSSMSMSRLPRRLASDLRDVFAQPLTFLVALVYLISAASVVAFFPKEGQQAQQAVNAPPPAQDRQQVFADWWNAQPRVDLGIPTDGAKVVVVKFNDWMCPGCRQAQIWYQPILDKLAKSDPGAVKYVVKDWPWNQNCNFNATSTIRGHEASCDAAAAARMAKDRGKYDEMTSWLYENQGTTPLLVRQNAQRILGISEAEYIKEYPLKIADVKRDVADGGVLRVHSTPTFYINGVALPIESMMPPEYFELAINLEMKKPKL
jgi:uncharacterized membrane protein/protein-disulfide isomerase